MPDAGTNDHTPDYSQYPWKHVNSLTQIYRDSPVLLSLELSTLTVYLILLLHAISHRKLPVLVSATVAGAVNELIFTNVPLVNNFWHAQAWLMLGPRLPLWQPALYAFFLYTASQSAERLRLAGWHAIGRASAAGLLGFLALFPLDAVCVKFVSYTWHDSDPLLSERLMGVAVGNGMFAAAFSGCFAALLVAMGPLGAAALSTPAMVAVTLPITQYLGNGVPSHEGLTALLVVMATTCVVSVALSRPSKLPPTQDWTPTLVAIGHFTVLLAVAALADPSAQKSIGFHQPMWTDDGPCRGDTEGSASGRGRRVFLCPGSMQFGDFNPMCDPAAGIDQHWYAVCGKPFGGNGLSRRQFVANLAVLAFMGIAGLVGCQIA